MRSRSTSSVLAAGLLLCSAGASWTVERAPLASSALAANEYHRVTLNELVGNEIKNPIAVSFEIPKGYVRRAFPQAPGQQCWGTARDLERLTADREHSISSSVQEGLIVAEVSTSVGYDPRSRKFTGEDQMKGQLLAAGATNVVVLRRDAGRYPILQMTARLQGKWVRSIYVGLLVDTLAGFISFREPGDVQVWEHFVTSAKAGQ
jgi:hypothetical protein